MLDFLMISVEHKKQGIEVKPKFIIKKSKDLMCRGGDFYAVWIESIGLWSTEEQDAIDLIDKSLTDATSRVKEEFPNDNVSTYYLWDAVNGVIDKWHRFCQKQMRDSYHMLDETIIFSNHNVVKEDYASKKLSYPLEEGDYSAFDKIIGTLYSPEERHKIEWAIGAIVTGDSKTIQKFMVFYGSAGTGKSTILNIIQKLFEGYYSVFDAKALGSSSNAFALEAFKNNPLVAIQHDGDLSRIEDNTRLNSLVSHEEMTINEKFKSTYTNRFKCFLFMGTNKPVKITDGKSGLIRRLIDVSPTGVKLKPKEYKRLVEQVNFELGAIAYHCREVYLENPGKYDNYIPTEMMGASNDFYNFVENSYRTFAKHDCTTANSAWTMYNDYNDKYRTPYPLSFRAFREELKNYFWHFKEHTYIDGENIAGYYEGFRKDRFVTNIEDEEDHDDNTSDVQWLKFDNNESIFDKECSECFAQYATDSGTPVKKWDNVITKLKDIDTSKLHYVKVPENHIVIDFDIPDEEGNKCFEKNLVEANKWPKTYAELSKSGGGIHLHYIYKGDVAELNRIYDEHIEIKVYTGKSSLRRKLTKCNDIPISNISSGLPLKEDKKVINFDSIHSEKKLREMIDRNLDKEFHGATAPSVHFIKKILDDAYDSGLKYDVTDMRNSVLAFASQSTHQAEQCIKLVNQMHFKSNDANEAAEYEDDSVLVFFDIEVFPNLFLVNYKVRGEGQPVVRLVNPAPVDIEKLLKFKLVGFNCRDYDNHMLYAALMGYTNKELYNLSTRLINEDRAISREAKFGEAFNISYTDVYDFAAKKQSLKKWEIELGIHHQELGLPWDQPVPKEKWNVVAEYCDNDVLATEAVFEHLKGDFTARQILADIAGCTVNDKTNTLTTRFVFGNNRNPQSSFNWRDMGEVSSDDIIPEGFDEYTRFNKKGQPVFPGYEYDQFTHKSLYRGEDPSEGGYVYAEPGMYGNVALLDIASLHPSSAINEEVFGTEYTKRFADIKQARIYIKHKEFDKARHMLDGALAPYLNDESTAKELAQALKIAINSVYGLTSAKFPNAFKDPNNIDNIVAKRGALFMINLKYEVQKRGFTVVHIKTDSIKIADATPDIIQFVMDYGHMYGYDFEHEATYDRICLVNDAVYIAKDQSDGHWTATGTQFQVPYVFKKLFSKEDITFEDMCETKSVKAGLMYLDKNENLPDVLAFEKELSNRVWNDNHPDKKPKRTDPAYASLSDEDLKDEIAKGHNYIFIGRVGQFCPIKPGKKGGKLYRHKDGKYFAVTGTTGYRWLESEMVKILKMEENIDRSYYEKLCNDAIETVNFFGDFEWFVSDDRYIGPDYDEEGRPIYNK